jgi:cytochrome o ubiquinol oxidase operon protein cyoD
MNKENKTNHQSENHGSITSYVIGFLLSLGFTLAAYYLVTTNVIENPLLIPSILTLAFLQLLVQLFYFLHLGQEKKPRWNLVFFLLTAMTIMTVVIGALWIMQHLNANMMPDQVQDFIIHDEGLKTDSSLPYK